MNYLLEDLLKRFETERRNAGYSENTIDRIMRTIRMLARDMHLNNLDELTTSVVTTWGTGRLAGQFNRRVLTRSALSTCYASIRSFCIFLDECHIPHSVNYEIVRERAKYRRRKPLRPNDIRLILKFADNREIAVLINLLSYTAMRLSEALELQATDISRQNEIIVSGKSKEERSVFLHDRLRWELKQLHNDEGYFFRDKQDPSKPLSRRNAYYHIVKAYRLAGYDKGYSPHCERHGNATELLSNGANLALVSKYLGHQNIETTQIYTHLVTDDVRRMLQAYMPTMASFS